MNRGYVSSLALAIIGLLMSCVEPLLFFTVAIYEDGNRFVRLRVVQDFNNNEGYGHPVAVSDDEMARILSGLVIEKYTLFSSQRHRAFSEREVAFFAPLLATGLNQATPEEIVTFFEAVEVSPLDRMVTSGGVFVKGEGLQIVLSNHGVRVAIRQDTEEYEAPSQRPPLEPIDPEWTAPGRLDFEPIEYRVRLEDTSFKNFLQEEVFHVAVRFRELARESGLD